MTNSIKFLIRIACLFVFYVSAFGADWVELRHCTLAENLSNDGDSFSVQLREPYMGQKQVRFRLYFVDTAETDSNSDFKKDRLEKQAAYWESRDSDFAMQMGMRAAQSVTRRLRGGFSVFTKGEYAPTLGTPRFYALVEIDGTWLDEWLVEQGLARIYGQGAELPDGTDAEDHRRHLFALERKARAAGKNGWRYAADEPDAPEAPFEPYDSVIVRTSWIYSAKDGRKVMALPANTAVSVIAEESDGRLRVRFKKPGRVFEGLCDKRNLK